MRKSPKRKAEPDLVRPSDDFLEALRLHAKGYFGVSNKYLRVADHGRPPYKTTLTVSEGVYRELKRLTWKKFREDAERDVRAGICHR